jgi:hypothetical protein
MTELEWLKQQSGLTDDELKAMESVAGHSKFVGMLQKIIASNETALKEKADAEKARLDFEKRYNEEFIPEMRKVTQDSIRAQGELAAAQARLKKAEEYGIVPEPEPVKAEPPRAPGSPDPNLLTRDEFGKFSSAQSNAIVEVNRLNADHFKLFGQPLGDLDELMAETTRQRTLGNKTYSLRQAWEAKHNVPAKREELAKAERQKEIDAAIAADRKLQAEKHGSNPNLRSGVQSRFSTYKSTDAAGGKEPWKASHSVNERNRGWRQKAIQKVSEAMAG